MPAASCARVSPPCGAWGVVRTGRPWVARWPRDRCSGYWTHGRARAIGARPSPRRSGHAGSARGRRSRRSARGIRARAPGHSAPAPRCTRSRAATGRDRRSGWPLARCARQGRLSCNSSGTAFERPPAPTSWIDRIGLSSPRAQQASRTSWQRRSISALSRCTEAKSSPSSPVPALIDEAAPPPSPMRIAGPPSTTITDPGETGRLWVWPGRMLPRPPASMTGLW